MFCGTDSPHIGPGPLSLGAASALDIDAEQVRSLHHLHSATFAAVPQVAVDLACW